MNKIKAIIVDDEFFNRGLINMLITKLNPNFVVSGEAESVNEGYKLISEIGPDVVFLDIKMPDGSGFDLLKKFTSINFEVVFITGFDKYALQAFEHNALDYVLKPVDLDKFKQTLERVERRLNKSRAHEVEDELSLIPRLTTKIPIHFNDKVVLLPVNEIQHILSKDGSTQFFKNQNEKYSSTKPLSDFGSILEGFKNFVRINKVTYINLNFVASYSKGMECFITMRDGTVMEISTRIKAEMIELFNQANANPHAQG